jgi:hypothetical protein
MGLIKSILILLGTLSLCIGVIGIVVPGLPTTPFLLLTAGLYVKSSDKLYAKLIANRFVGSYIVNFNQRKGMTIKSKFYAIITMWTMIALSCVFFIEPLTIIVAVSAFGIIGTIVMGFVVPTINN